MIKNASSGILIDDIFLKYFLGYEDRFYRYESAGGVSQGCPIDYLTIPVTFKNSKSYVKLTGYEGADRLNVSLEFRTYEENGLLVYHGFRYINLIIIIMEIYICFMNL